MEEISSYNCMVLGKVERFSMFRFRILWRQTYWFKWGKLLWWKVWVSHRGSDTGKNHLLEILYNIESTKDKMPETKTILGVWQFAKAQKRLSLYKSYDENKKTKAAFKILLITFYKEIKHFNSQCFSFKSQCE